MFVTVMRVYYRSDPPGRQVELADKLTGQEKVVLDNWRRVDFTKSCPTVEELVLRACKRMTPTSLMALPKLRSLSLDNNYWKSVRLCLPPLVKDITVFERKLENFQCNRSACVKSLLMDNVKLKDVEFLCDLPSLQRFHVRWTLWDGVIEKFEHPRLVDVSITGASITRMGALPQIKTMELHLATVPSGWSQASTLTKLSLYFNTCHSFRFIGCLINLTDLTITHIIPRESGRANLAGLQYIRQLQNLTLGGLYAFVQPPVGGWCHSLVKVGIHHCLLEDVPSFVLEARNVIELSLANNHITDIPPEITHLQRIRSLDLSNNALCGFPVHVTGITSLTELNLTGRIERPTESNVIFEIPPEIRHLCHLEVLEMRYAGLTTVSRELYELRQLVKLDITNNPIERLPSGISRMEGLRYLYLDNSNLIQMPEGLFDCPKIWIVSVNHTPLHCLPWNMHRARHLLRVNARHTNIKKLPVSIGDASCVLHFSGSEFDRLPLSVINNPICLAPTDRRHMAPLYADLEHRCQSTYWAYGVKDEFPESTRTFQAFVMLCAKRNCRRLPDEIWMHVFSFLRIKDFRNMSMH